MKPALRVLLASNSLGGGSAPAPEPTWQEVFATTSAVSEAGWGNASLRTIIPAASLVNLTATKLRLTFAAGTAGSLLFDNVFVGKPAGAGDAYDFDGGQVRVTFDGGSNGVTIAANNTKLSDEVTISTDGTTPLIVAMDYGAVVTTSKSASISGASSLYKLSVDEASQTDVTGYTEESTRVTAVIKIEAFG